MKGNKSASAAGGRASELIYCAAATSPSAAGGRRSEGAVCAAVDEGRRRSRRGHSSGTANGRQMTQAFAPRKLPGTASGPVQNPAPIGAGFLQYRRPTCAAGGSAGSKNAIDEKCLLHWFAEGVFYTYPHSIVPVGLGYWPNIKLIISTNISP